MSNHEPKSNVLPDAAETQARTADHPTPLPGNPQRQAVSSIQGYVYQAWWSIDAWLRLTGTDEVIYLECAEDFDIVKSDTAIAVQVKRNAGSISLGNAKSHEALENFWNLSCQDESREIDFHYLTTSMVALEQDEPFGVDKGLDVWRAAQTNPDLATQVSGYLISKLSAHSPLRAFLTSATPRIVQERLIKRFHWLTNQPDIDTVKRSVDERITAHLKDQGNSLSLQPKVRNALESRFWEMIIEPQSSMRCLTYGDFLRQVDEAITTYLPIKVDQLPDIIGNSRPGLNLLRLLRQKTPRPPRPLLQRIDLTQRLEELLNHRKVVLLTGTVHKGKTTIAQLTCSALCPEAWWINLSGRKFDQVDNIFLALAEEIENGDCPSLVVIDDLDISPVAHRVYRDSLFLVMHRANSKGRGLLLTAQGGSSNLVVKHDFENVELLEVPALSSSEVQALCIEHGCLHEIAKVWGSLVAMHTGGHPKLVQVRLAELSDRNWPKPDSSDLISQSPAVASVQQMARQLLSASVSAPTAEFVYLVSVCSVPIHKSVAIRLAETVEGLQNGGDVLDGLTGKWLEQIDEDSFQVTQLLKGVVSNVWSTERLKRAHVCLHDAILAKRKLDPYEAAALIFHAYMGGEPSRLAKTASRLQILDDTDARKEVERQLLWLPYVALETGQTISDDAFASVVLRGLQFRVALVLDADCLPKICARWSDEIEQLTHPEAKAVNQTLMWLSTGFSESQKVPLKPRLDAIMGIPTLPDTILKTFTDPGSEFFKMSNSVDGLPEIGTTAQAIFLCLAPCVRDLNNIDELLQWLDGVATEEIRQQFDTMLEWPLMQSLGAFVHGVYASVHESIDDWSPWLDILARVDEYAKRRNTPRFGREAAKNKAIILAEHLDQAEEALEILVQAEEAYGPSPVLMEQRANVLFQKQDDSSVLDVWRQLTGDKESRGTLDPFAYRRAGMSAARLEEWEKAGQIFLEGANIIPQGELELTKFGLLVDAALAVVLGGNRSSAAQMLLGAVLSLPDCASEEGHEQWEAVQRAAVAVSSYIENSLWRASEAELKVAPGYASSPGLKMPKTVPGQATRSEMTRVQIAHLNSTLAKNGRDLAQELAVLSESKNFSVRWMAIESQLAIAYSTGAGPGFIEALLAFNSSVSEAPTHLPQSGSNSTDGLGVNLSLAPDQWFGLLCAGLVCSGSELLGNLQLWLDASSRLLDKDAALTTNIQLLLEGASLSTKYLMSVLVHPASPSPVRCGAAARLLNELLPAEKVFEIQSFLTSAMVSDDSRARQQLFNIHVARCFADTWRAHAKNRFQFCTPSVSVPALLTTLDGVDCGSSTLRSVLVSASNSLGLPLGEFMSEVV